MKYRLRKEWDGIPAGTEGKNINEEIIRFDNGMGFTKIIDRCIADACSEYFEKIETELFKAGDIVAWEEDGKQEIATIKYSDYQGLHAYCVTGNYDMLLLFPEINTLIKIPQIPDYDKTKWKLEGYSMRKQGKYYFNTLTQEIMAAHFDYDGDKFYIFSPIEQKPKEKRYEIDWNDRYSPRIVTCWDSWHLNTCYVQNRFAGFEFSENPSYRYNTNKKFARKTHAGTIQLCETQLPQEKGYWTKAVAVWLREE